MSNHEKKTFNEVPAERRHSKRQPCSIPVQVMLEGTSEGKDSFWLETVDLSPDGAFLRTDLLLSMRQGVCIEFPNVETAHPVRRAGRVVRASVRPGQAGVAVCWNDRQDLSQSH